MVSAFAAFGFADLCLAFAALELFTFLDPHHQCGAGTTTSTATTSAQAPLLHSAAAEVLPPLAAAVALFVAVALTNRHLMVMGRRHAADGRRSISGLLVMFTLCVSAGTLEFIVFVQVKKAAGAGGGGGGGGAGHGAPQALRALGLAALRALPAAATATFFLGMTTLVVAAHVRAGGESGGTTTGAVVAGAGDDGPIPGLLRLLAKIAAGAAAALVGLMVMATLTLHGTKY